MAIILLKHGQRTKLARDFGVSMVTLARALAGKTKSELANAIRKEALKRGGEQYTKSNPHPCDQPNA